MNQYLRRKIWTLNRSGKFRGYLRTVSGYPVTLTDCMAGQPVSLAVDGNAVQDGTPTPDNPIDVQLCGDRTGNLFDINNLSLCMTSISSIDYTPKVEDGVFYSGGQLGKASGQFPYIEIGDAETVTIYFTVSGETPNGYIYGFDDVDDDGIVIGNVILNNFSNNFGTITFTYTGAKKYIGICVFSQNVYGVKLSNIQIIKGAYTAETMPAYEPYGYKVPLTIKCGNLYTGELLFKSAGVSIEQIPSGYRFSYEKATSTFLHARYKCHNVKPYTAYTAQINVKVNSFSEDTRFVFRAFENKNVSDYLKTLKEYATTYSELGIGEIKDITIKFNTKECTDIYLQTNFSWLESSKFDVEITDIKLTEDEITPQTFNIYTPQQLAKVGDTADTVVLDFDNKKATLTNNIGDFVLTNMQAAQTSYSNDNYSSYYVVNYNFNTMGMKKDTSIVCDKLPFRRNSQSDLNGNGIGFGGNPSLLYVCISKLIASDAASVSGILEGSKCYMPLLNPITTDITALQDWDAMPSLWSGTAEITADTVIAPSAITAKYYASKPEEVN